MIRIERFAATPGSGDPATTRGLERCLEIRTTVFVVGQGIESERELDGLDGEAEHFLARERVGSEEALRGTARLRALAGEAKVERVAVLEAARRRGIGSALMRSVESRAWDLGLRVAVLNAQLRVVPFYERLGYVAEGEVFDDAGIPHRRMRKRLDPPERRAAPRPGTADDQRGSQTR